MSASVNVPANPKQRDRDVDNKLRLYGIYSAFANGKLPSNRQIDVALSSFANHPKLRNPNNKLSGEGRVILEDFRNVIEEAKRLLLIKNHDQALQEFIWNATQLGQKGGPNSGAPGVPVGRETANRDAQQGMEGLQTLGQLIITNGQFRKLLNDALVLLRDIAGDAATKTASRINPSEDQLRQIDDPAPDHEWHDAPNFSKQNLKQQFREKTDRNKPISRDELRDVTGNATQAADPYGSRDPLDTAERGAHDQRHNTSSGVDARQGLRAGVDDLTNRMDQNIPEDQKQRGREYRDRTQEYLRSKMPRERREQTIWRLKKMIIEIQGHQDYSQAIDTLLNLVETYSGHGRNVASQTSSTAKTAHRDDHLSAAERSLKTLLERFANYTSADDFMDALNDLYSDADRDPELKNWFRSVDRYIRRCLKEQGYIMEEDSTREHNQLYDHGNFLLRNRYRDHTDRLMDEARFFADQFSADADNQRFGSALQKLFNDLGNDNNGKPVFKKHLLKDITEVVLPDMFESVRYVPIPRIEYSDRMFDAVVENLVLESDNLMPNVLEVGNDSYFRFGRHSISNKNKQQVMISASQIQCDLRDISYYVRRKQGFPSITDTGVADIFLGGDGFSFKLQLSTADKTDRARFFKVDHVDVSIKHMNIKLKQSKHKLLFGLFKPLLLKILRPVILKALEQQIHRTFSELDALCYRIYTEQKKIESELKSNPDPEHAQNIYNRYYSAFQREMMVKRKKAEEKVADKKVNMAVTREDSIFKDIKLPGGISTRATEFKNMAREGDAWQSEVFSIGSASPTQGLATKPQSVTRKSPHAQRRTLKNRDRDSGFQQENYAGGYDSGMSGGANPVVLSVPLSGGDEGYSRKYGTGNALGGGNTLGTHTGLGTQTGLMG